MKVVLFHIRTREDINEADYQRTFERMVEIVSAMPGFRGIDGFTGEDGRELAVVWFDSDEALAGWKRQPEHLDAQEKGRKEFFSAYEVTVAEVDRRYGWPDTEDASSGQQPSVG
jgi:heme-degrading monooxygenase HmoA